MAYDLKKAEEVKEYLKNLHIEYRFGCESEKNPEVCHLLADYQESIERDFVASAKTYKDNCDERKFGQSCRKYGGYALVGKGIAKPSVKEGYEYMKKGCEYGDQVSCANTGIIATSLPQESEAKGPIDFPLGLKLLDKSCNEYKVEKACYHLSGLYLNGVPGYLERDANEARNISLQACELGNAYACANLSQMYVRGDGVEKNTELAEAFKNKALAIQKAVREAKHIAFQQGADG